MSYELNDSVVKDIKHLNIVDYIGGQSIKIYPYLAFRADQSKTIIQIDTSSIIGLTTDQNKLRENGIIVNAEGYIEVMGLRDKNGRIDISKPNKVTGLRIKNATDLTAITNQVPSSHRMQPIFVTVDEPFDKNAYENGQQDVFLLGTVVPADDFNDDFTDLDIESLSQVKLTNVTVIEQQFESARMFFDTNASDIGLIDNVKIRTQKNILISRVIGRGKESDYETDIDLTATSKMMPFKGSVVSTQDRVEIFAD